MKLPGDPPCEDKGCMFWMLILTLLLACPLVVWLIRFFW
jgi:hypothetical protein